MRRMRAAAALVLALAGLAAGGAANALDRGATAAGEPYVSGGVGLEEIDALQREKPRYNLWVRTAARGSGAYLAGVQLLISDARGRAVFNKPLDGPWLLIALLPGSYTLYATWNGVTAAPQRVTVAPQERRDAIFYFDAAE